MNKLESARMEGMSYALRIAKETGVEGLEEDIKMRGITKLPIPVNKKSLDECVMNIKNNVLDTVLVLSAATLRDQFGFGQKRINEFIVRFNEKAEGIQGDYCSWSDYIDMLKEECNITLEVRDNSINVKV